MRYLNQPNQLSQSLLFKSFCIIILILQISACDIGFKEEDKDDETLQESNKILNEYRAVQGEYLGRLNLDVNGENSSVEVEIKLQPKISYSGRQDGELIPQVEMSGTFNVTNFIWPYNDVTFVGRYWYAQDGRLTMVANSVDIWFQAYPQNNALTRGELWSSKGKYGDFTADRISQDVRAPGEGDDEEERRRYEKSYQDLIGTFIGDVDNQNDPEQHRRQFPLRFRFYMQGNSISATVDRPDSRTNHPPRPLAVEEYRPDTGLVVVKGSDLGRVGVPGYGKFYARGYLKKGVLEFVEISDHYGSLGRYFGEKQR